MKANQDKCHFLSVLDITTKLSDYSIENWNSEKPLEVMIGRKLNFQEHITNLCKKASKNQTNTIHSFSILPAFQRKCLMNAHFLSQFWYCPLVSMNHSRVLNNRIYGWITAEYSSTFSELLMKEKSVTIQQRNLQALAYEMFKVKKNLALEIMHNTFFFKTVPYNLRNSTTLHCRDAKIVLYGSETISSLGPKVWHF